MNIPLINEGLKLQARIRAEERSDIFPEYYTRKHMIKLCFFISDEGEEIGSKLYLNNLFKN